MEENARKKLMTLVLSMIFLDMTPRAQETKVEMNNYDYIKLKKNFFTVKKKKIKNAKAIYELGENIYTKISDKGYIISTEFMQLNNNNKKSCCKMSKETK